MSGRAVLSWKTIAAFGATGAVGPVAALALFRLSPYSGAYDFIYDFVWAVWPTWSLAVTEVTIGTPLAATIAIAANLLLFTVAGLIVAALARWRTPLLLLWATCLAAVAAWAGVGAGGSVDHFRWSALLGACVAYSVPFECARRLHRGSR